MGAALPARARREVERLAARLALVERQIAEVEAERDAAARCGRDALDGGCAGGRRGAGLGEDRGAGPAQGDRRQRRDAAGPRGCSGAASATAASWPAGAGIAPAPWASGKVRRDQGIGRDGPGWVRAQLIQMAWRWLRFQPDSALARWFERRTAGGDARARPGDDHRARPQAADRAVAPRRDRPRADRRPARLRPRASGPPTDAAGAGPGGARAILTRAERRRYSEGSHRSERCPRRTRDRGTEPASPETDRIKGGSAQHTRDRCDKRSDPAHKANRTHQTANRPGQTPCPEPRQAKA